MGIKIKGNLCALSIFSNHYLPETHPHTTCIWAALPYIVILIVLAMLYFLLLLLYEKGLGKNKRLYVYMKQYLSPIQF